MFAALVAKLVVFHVAPNVAEFVGAIADELETLALVALQTETIVVAAHAFVHVAVFVADMQLCLAHVSLVGTCIAVVVLLVIAPLV